MIPKNEGNDEESDPQEYSHSSNDVDEMGNFFGDGCFTCVQTRGQAGNSSHDSVVTNVDHYTLGRAFHSIGGEEGQVPVFEMIKYGRALVTWSYLVSKGFS